jgi:CheY-like chemotaxis protein
VSSAPSSPTILVVEDNDAVRRVIVAFLESAGYTVLIASDGTEALAIAATTPIDLVLSDVVMPGPPVQSVIDELRRRQPVLRVVLTSGFPAEQLDTTWLAADEREILAKPFTRAQLLDRVRSGLRVPPS